MTVPKDWPLRIIQLLALPGILVAFYLYLYHSGSLFSTCTINEFFDCGQVSGPGSPYASIGPIPVALIGLVGYVTIFFVVWIQDWVEIVAENLPELMMGIVSLAFLFTLGLTALELFVIHAFCQYCLYSAAIILVMFLLAIVQLIRSRKPAALQTKAPKESNLRQMSPQNSDILQ
jgi:uncharacterized membrane protein